jgi:hypothetical protein
MISESWSPIDSETPKNRNCNARVALQSRPKGLYGQIRESGRMFLSQEARTRGLMA